MNKARLGGLLGIAYCVAGFFLIFLGWNGAATYDQVEAQMPYIVSGGIGGLGLIVLGSALIVTQSVRAGQADLRGTLDDLRAAVERGGVAGATSAQAAAVSGDTVMAGPTSYHRATCRVIVGQIDVVAMSRVAAAASNRTACRVCTPDTPTLTAAS